MIGNHESIVVFIGLDVGKSEHHAVALDRSGKKLFDKALPNDEARLREILLTLKRHGNLLLVVDQPATIGALPVAVVQVADVTVGYLPGLAMRRIPDLQTCPVPLRLRGAKGPAIQGLLRPKTVRGKTPQSSPYCTRPPPLRHPLRHAQRRNLLRTTTGHSRLTKTIEAPPGLRTMWMRPHRRDRAAPARIRHLQWSTAGRPVRPRQAGGAGQVSRGFRVTMVFVKRLMAGSAVSDLAEGSGADHVEECIGSPAWEGDEGLIMALAVGAFAAPPVPGDDTPGSSKTGGISHAGTDRPTYPHPATGPATKKVTGIPAVDWSPTLLGHAHGLCDDTASFPRFYCSSHILLICLSGDGGQGVIAPALVLRDVGLPVCGAESGLADIKGRTRNRGVSN
ncbi:hypothetical protein H4V95_002265 [Arthrobacter sp. CAN_C5]|nr:hypothetical protein [Arthrobacter sp. CAN_C5]